MNFHAQDQNRALANLINIGTLSEIDHQSHKARVVLGDCITDFLPLPAVYGNNFHATAPAIVGAQVVVVAPFGQLEAGAIVCLLASGAHAPVDTTGDVDVIQFNDGSKIEYDSRAQIMTINAAKDLIINVADNSTVTITGDLTATINQNATVEVKQKLTATVGADLNANIKGKATIKAAGKVDIKGATVDINQAPLGVVTGGCICPFTGKPHADISQTVRAGK